MRRPIAVLLLIAIVAAAAAGEAAAKPPTQSQIRAAVRKAEKSSTLWSTVNICNTRAHRHTIGIRGQMPALGFNTVMSMQFQVNYWAGKKRGFVHDPGVRKKLVLGTFSHGLHQVGYTFTFKPPAFLSGEITFRWWIGNKLIGRKTKLTASGVKGVDGGDPSGYSTATCRIKK